MGSSARPGGGHPILLLLIAFVVLGAGLGAASVASTQAGTEAAGADDRGVAAGVLNSSAQIGTTLGLSTIIAVAGTGRGGFLGTCALAVAGLAAALLIPADHHSRAGDRRQVETGSTEPQGGGTIAR